MDPPRVFLLSPARCDGRRAELLLSARASFPLAARMREGNTAPIGEVFSFLSGLYFRGKLTYAHAFSRPPRRAAPILVITTDRGLVTPEERVGREDLVGFSRVDIAAGDDRYLGPLRRDIDKLADTLEHSASVVLLGSIAT